MSYSFTIPFHFCKENLCITKVLYNPQVILQIVMWPSRVFRIPGMFGEYQEREFVFDCATWRELRLMSLTMLKMIFLFNAFLGKWENRNSMPWHSWWGHWPTAQCTKKQLLHHQPQSLSLLSRRTVETKQVCDSAGATSENACPFKTCRRGWKRWSELAAISRHMSAPRHHGPQLPAILESWQPSQLRVGEVDDLIRQDCPIVLTFG